MGDYKFWLNYLSVFLLINKTKPIIKIHTIIEVTIWQKKHCNMLVNLRIVYFTGLISTTYLYSDIRLLQLYRVILWDKGVQDPVEYLRVC